MTDRPTSADILVAIAKVAAMDWIDPASEAIYWDCQLYDANGFRMGDGSYGSFRRVYYRMPADGIIADRPRAGSPPHWQWLNHSSGS